MHRRTLSDDTSLARPRHQVADELLREFVATRLGHRDVVPRTSDRCRVRRVA
jgi:hypothetical protein